MFFGDNGQGDESVARKLAKAYPVHCRLCCIHVVQPVDKTQEQVRILAAGFPGSY